MTKPENWMHLIGHQEEPGEVCRPDCEGCKIVKAVEYALNQERQHQAKLEARVKELRQLVIDDVPHRYQSRLLEAINGTR